MDKKDIRLKNIEQLKEITNKIWIEIDNIAFCPDGYIYLPNCKDKQGYLSVSLKQLIYSGEFINLFIRYIKDNLGYNKKQTDQFILDLVLLHQYDTIEYLYDIINN